MMGSDRGRGFTLVEMLIVVIIIAALSTLAVSQYMGAVERGRTAEAKMLLLQIKAAQKNHEIDYGEYAVELSRLDCEAPGQCDAAHYFRYYLFDGGKQASAVRCTAGGKSPNHREEYTITINCENGEMSGTPGYF